MQPTQRDLDKFKEIEDKKRDINHPVTGDFVELKDGTIERIAHIWDDGDIQFMDGNGSFFLCNNGSCSMSGSLKSGVQLELEKVGTKEGYCWFFSNGIQGMGRGTTNTIQFNLFREVKINKNQSKDNEELQAWIKEYCTPTKEIIYDDVKKNDLLSEFITLKTVCFRVVERCGFITIDLNPNNMQ